MKKAKTHWKRCSENFQVIAEKHHTEHATQYLGWTIFDDSVVQKKKEKLINKLTK